ncbi:MAG TPA: amidohydrolase [Tahibacter sp.]|uniref:amidohydrolase n=1 Tax=Tahibacter sp. TaxID=2056211 RepID=UPI002BE259D9|nr:amidohydrolase [Tahibacter sp.]HSX60597.1 amidohydrolase [Tahibacter sp.]
MKRSTGWLLAAGLLALNGTTAATTVLHDGRIGVPGGTAEAVAWDDAGRIVAVGSKAELAQRYPDAAKLDAHGAAVLPGLVDAHGHVLGLGLSLLNADLRGTASKAQVIERLRAHAAKLPAGAWLVGRGWDQNDWPEKQFPTAADLDAAFPDRPVYLRRIDGHAAWANTAALSRAARDLAGDWQPDGGRIERVGGKPTGVFVDAAMHLVDEVVPKPDAALKRRAYRLAFETLLANGLTGVHDAGVSRDDLAVLRGFADAGELPLRIYAMADGDGEALDALCRDGLYRHADGRLQMRAVKLYIDGALGSRGAALKADYSDDPGNRGLLVTAPDAFRAVVAKAKRCNVQVATHAIGDRGTRLVLDTYAGVLDAAAQGDHRWRVEHAQIVDVADFPRFAQLRVIASMQPTHATSDMPWAQARVGEARLAGAYAWRRFMAAKVPLALGSDFPVEQVSPLLGLYAAVTRQDLDAKPAGGWLPAQRLSLDEAVRGFTAGAAFAEFAESDRGTIAVGKQADFTLLRDDPYAIDAARIPHDRIAATIVDGKVVYGSLDRPAR